MQRGVSIVELMICIVLVVALTASVGPSAVKLWRVHESSRREGFVREKLSMLSGRCADWLSLSESVVATAADGVEEIHARYPDEMDGVSFETNDICKVTAFHSVVSNELVQSGQGARVVRRWHVWFDTADPRFPGGRRGMTLDGDALLEHAGAGILSVLATPLDVPITNYCRLSILATNRCWSARHGSYSIKTVGTERLVRLWNATRR